ERRSRAATRFIRWLGPRRPCSDGRGSWMAGAARRRGTVPVGTDREGGWWLTPRDAGRRVRRSRNQPSLSGGVGERLAGEAGQQVVDGDGGHALTRRAGGRADVRDDERVRSIQDRGVG